MFMMSHIVIHTGTIEDLEALTILFDQYRIFYKQTSDIDSCREFLAIRMKLKESVIFIATYDDVVVGFTQLYPSFSSVTLQRSFILNDLYVLSEYRGKGIASALLEHSKEFTIHKGYKGLALETGKDNPAQHLYERSGWIEEKKHLFYYWTAAPQ